MKIKILISILFVSLIFISCNSKTKVKEIKIDTLKQINYVVYSPYSKNDNKYIGFNSPKAINCIADIENEYFNKFDDSISRYYGTIWANGAGYVTIEDKEFSVFDEYVRELSKLNIKPDSLHCTIYAIKALQAGLEDNLTKFEEYYRKIWKKREYAGWSVAYILTEKFNWKAYLIIDKNADEYQRCLSNYKKYKNYWVWKQPSIKLENMFILGENDSIIINLLKENEFGWGFSYQGIHTWITNFETLKECKWEGAPAKKYNKHNSGPLFKKHNFLEFHDYNSHIIVFPPKNT